MSSSEDLEKYLKNCFKTLNMDMVDNTYQNLTELGVERPSDLHFLEEADLCFMKPIHIRKFLGFIKNKTSDNDYPLKEMAPVKPQHAKKLIQPHLQSSWADYENMNRSTQPMKNVTHCTTEKEKEGKESICKRESVSERDTYGCVN